MLSHHRGNSSLFLILPISAFCFMVADRPVAAAADALLMGAAGKVETQKSRTAVWENAKGGIPLHHGDSVRTGAKSQADIRFQSAIISTYEDSLLELLGPPQAPEFGDDAAAPIRTLLHNGHLRFRTFQKPGERFEVMTPTVTVGGRDAAFQILEKDTLRVVVVSGGAVEVRNRECPGEVITVKAGHYTLLMKNRLTAARVFQSDRGFYIEKELMKEQLKLAGEPESEKKPCMKKEVGDTSKRIEAQSRDRRVQDRPSSTSFRLIPSAIIPKRYDDNILFARDGKESDIITRLAPGLQFTTATKALSGSLGYRALFEYYEDNKDLNEVKHFADLDWTAHVSEKSSLTLEDHFSFTTDSTEFPSVTVAAPRGDAFANDLTGEIEFPGFGFAYRQEDRYFDLAQLVDGVSRKFEEHLALPLSAHQSLTQSYRLRFYRLQPQDDFLTVFRSNTAGIGLRHYFSPDSFMGLEGGISYWRDISDVSFRSEGMVRLDIESLFPLDQSSGRFKVILSYQEDIESQWLAAVDYTVKGTVFGIQYSRELILGSGLLAQTVTREGAGVKFGQAVGRNTEFNLTATYAKYKSFSDNLPQFTTYQGNVGFSHTFQAWLKGEIGYNFFIQDSKDLAGLFEFTRNQATVGITAMIP